MNLGLLHCELASATAKEFKGSRDRIRKRAPGFGPFSIKNVSSDIDES